MSLPSVPADTSRPADRQAQIQGLRALAVVSVVLYHFAPSHLPGGYVGVDVFFVISGYLMTKSVLHLRETGHRSVRATLCAFYARRVARILPAALVVLLMCAAGVVVLTGRYWWYSNLRQIMASSLFFENWYLAGHRVDYLHSSQIGPVQHFWSLSVEEQFYAVWPILVIAAATLAARGARRPRAFVLLGCFGVLTAVSFAYGLYQTSADAGPAYFNTGVRFWELSLGGLLYVVDRSGAIGARQRATAGWVGLVLVGYAILRFTDATAFPGWHAAVPTVGAALIILDSGAARGGPYRTLAWRAPQFLGDISYSIYLIHWPLLVLWGESHNTLGTNTFHRAGLVGALALTVILAWLLKTLVEDRFRISSTHPPASPAATQTARRWRHHSPAGLRTTVAFVVTLLVTIGVAVNAGIGSNDALVARAATANANFLGSADARTRCYAALSANRVGADCPDAEGSVLMTVPTALKATDDWKYLQCLVPQWSSQDRRCDLVNDNGPLALVVGDSHVHHWLPALVPWARTHHYSLSTYSRAVCPLSQGGVFGPGCDEWNQKVWDDIGRLRPALVITSAASAGSPAQAQAEVAAMVPRWQQLVARGTRLVVLADLPEPQHAGVADVPNCLLTTRSFAACSFSKARGSGHDVATTAARRVAGAHEINLSDVACPGSTCRPVRDGILVWIDGGHISATFAAAAERALAKRLDALIR